MARAIRKRRKRPAKKNRGAPAPAKTNPAAEGDARKVLTGESHELAQAEAEANERRGLPVPQD